MSAEYHVKYRWYQEGAGEAAIQWMRKSTEPCVIDAATGSGKSLIVSYLAHWFKNHTGKKVLALAPFGELVQQNYGKYKALGEKASIYSASLGLKSLRHGVVFGTPMSIKNALDRMAGFGLVIIDEGDGVTATVHNIVDKLREKNPHLRVVGLTATPFKLGRGYIYREDIDGTILTDDQTIDPYYHKLVYRVSADVLIKDGYLTPPLIGEHHEAPHYDTSGLVKTRAGTWSSESLDKAFVGKGRLTSEIVADIVAKSRDRKKVIIFAATVDHAREVLESLPPEISAMGDGSMSKADRSKLVEWLRQGSIKYLVNVNMYSVGLDVPDIDVVVLLRHSESPRLLTQQIGRGLRLAEGKKDCLILDYAGNVEKHFPNGDLFSPEITTRKSGERLPIKAKCPDCGYENGFTYRKDKEYEGLAISEDGYFIDTMGDKMDIPAHYGRRCWGFVKGAMGKYERCEYRWTGKECPECGKDNDIAARRCSSCKAEMVDPNDKLQLEAARDPSIIQTQEVISMKVNDWVSKAGNRTLKVVFTTEVRQVTVWVPQEPTKPFQEKQLKLFMDATNGGKTPPKTITYRKDGGFFKVYAYNQPLTQETVK